MPKHSPDPFRDWLRSRQDERFGIHNLAFALGCPRQTIYRWLAGGGVSRDLASAVIAHAKRRDGVTLDIAHLGARP